MRQTRLAESDGRSARREELRRAEVELSIRHRNPPGPDPGGDPAPKRAGLAKRPPPLAHWSGYAPLAHRHHPRSPHL